MWSTSGSAEHEQVARVTLFHPWHSFLRSCHICSLGRLPRAPALAPRQGIPQWPQCAALSSGLRTRSNPRTQGISRLLFLSRCAGHDLEGPAAGRSCSPALISVASAAGLAVLALGSASSDPEPRPEILARGVGLAPGDHLPVPAAPRLHRLDRRMDHAGRQPHGGLHTGHRARRYPALVPGLGRARKGGWACRTSTPSVTFPAWRCP